MKSETDVINDVFGEKSETFTRNDLIKAMSIFSNQFKWIKTTCGKNIEYDDFDYEVLRQQSIFLDAQRNILMALWYSEDGKRVSAPVAKLLLGCEGKSIIRYKDKNPFNLRRDNLELINHQTAHFKRKKPKTVDGVIPTSIYKGVSWNKFAGKWSAYIKIDFKKKHLGYFILEEDAARAYNKSAIEFFGKEYSELNVFI